MAGAAEDVAPIVGELPDAAIRRISQVLDTGVEPRVQGTQVHHVDVAGGYVLVVRVPGSIDGPHCVRLNNLRRFVTRNGTCTSDLTLDQLRAAFDRTATLSEKARHFVDQRVDLLVSYKEPKRLMEGAICAVHLVPIAWPAGRNTVDLRTLHARGSERFMGHDWGGCRRSFNFDGLIVHPGPATDEGRHFAYTHIFRTGAMEAAALTGQERDNSGSKQRIVWPVELVKFYRGNVAEFISAAKDWGFTGPAVLRFALPHVEGFELLVGDSFRRFGGALMDRQHLVLPDVWVESVDRADLDDVVRPMMDMLWQAFDVARCTEFDAKTGAYAPGKQSRRAYQASVGTGCSDFRGV